MMSEHTTSDGSSESSPEENTESSGNELVGTGLVNRVVSVLTLRPGAFGSIAQNPSTLQSLVVTLCAVALVGSVGTMLAMVLLIYPVLAVVFFTIRAAICRFVAGKVLAGQLPAQGLPSYSNWIRSQLFATAPLTLGLIPLVGSICGAVYSLILEVHAFKDMSGCSTGQALIVMIVSIIFSVVVLLVAVTFGGVAILGLGSLM